VASLPEAIERRDLSVVEFSIDSEGNFIAVKTAKNSAGAELSHREAVLLESLAHPLVLEVREGRDSSMVTQFAGNGALRAHLVSESSLRDPNRIAKIIAGIALAMRFVHSRGAIHRHLSPENRLLDWDCTVRLANFGHSASPEVSLIRSLVCTDGNWRWKWIDSRYNAQECYDEIFR
jgi:serine/threonine protein kinase